MKKFAAILMVVCGAANAQEFDSADLFKSCNAAVAYVRSGSTHDSMKALTCMAYVRGVIEGYNAVFEVTPEMDRLYCVPETVTYKDATIIVAKYLNANRATVRQYTPGSTVLAALKVAYPCE